MVASNKASQKIAIFASGSGSNAETIIQHFSRVPHIEVALVVSNKSDAYVLERANKHELPALVISKEDLSTEAFIHGLKSKGINLVVLAGFLLKIPVPFIQAFPNSIVNIHPSLLPKYGGPGMYGRRVHQAVFNAYEKESGMTIHLVNEHYDEGRILFQAKVELDHRDTPDKIAEKVLVLEHTHYPTVIADLLNERSAD